MSVTESISTARLTLTPLDVADAREMVGVLSDPALYTFTGGAPPTVGRLEDQYRAQTAGASRDGEISHNWILRLDGTAIGYVQATVKGDSADVAWVVGSPWQGSGYATEASKAVRGWLADGDRRDRVASINEQGRTPRAGGARRHSVRATGPLVRA